jgi:hypothetical protein
LGTKKITLFALNYISTDKAHILLNAVVEWLAILLDIQEIPLSNPGPDISSSD